jgi:capsular polysaccharide biosynthesis protein
MQVNNVTVVNKATVNTTPVSPNKKLFAIIGLLLGISLGVIWAIVKEITDTTVKEIDLLTNELGLTDLGVVYHISDNNKRFRIVNVEDDSNEDEPNNDIRRV